MAERWELVNVSGYSVLFYRPKGWEEIGLDDYLKGKGKLNIKKDFKIREAICCLLADGWEPMTDNYSRYRRKINT